ncbi:MAG: hypothetical protein WKG07_36085 [Hymenobacter sp.]
MKTEMNGMPASKACLDHRLQRVDVDGRNRDAVDLLLRDQRLDQADLVLRLTGRRAVRLRIDVEIFGRLRDRQTRQRLRV